MTITLQKGRTYDIITVDLSVAHDNYELYCPGDRLIVVSITGNLTVRLDEPDNPEIDLAKTVKLDVTPTKFKYLYFTNSAQSGKSAIIYVGRDASFFADPLRSAIVGVLDSEENRINPAKEDGNLASILSQLDIKVSELRDALLGEEAVENHATGLDETADQEISLDTKGHKLLEVYAKASASTTFYLDVSPDNTTWISGYMSWSSVTEVKETLWNGFRYVKLRSAAAGASGDTVDLYLSAK